MSVKLYSEENKWAVIREMVKEKYKELSEAISSITLLKGDRDVMAYKESEELFIERLKTCKKVVRKLFNVSSMDSKYKKDWLEHISAVDLLFVYSLLNDILICFYGYCPMGIEKIVYNDDIIIEYNLLRCGLMDRSNGTLYRLFEKNVKDFNIVSKLYDNKLQLKTFKTKSNDELVNLYNLDYRKSVVAVILQDAMPRIIKATDGLISDFDSARKKLRLHSHQIVEGKPECQCMGMISIPNPSKDILYGFDKVVDLKAEEKNDFNQNIRTDNSGQIHLVF